MVAPAGAGPCPQITSVLPRLTSWTITGTSPPGPLRCGSTTCSVKAVAQAASKALPPFSSTPMPTAVAIQCVEATTPKVPSISGRVVNGLGLILEVFAGVAGIIGLAEWGRLVAGKARQRRWQATICPGLTSRKAGDSTRQRSTAYGQR